MARQEQDREDLMAEARNFIDRCELRVPGEKLPVVTGFRRDGRLSIYFGQDPVYHFDSAGRIRRAFVADHLYKAEWGRLVRLTRSRSPEATYLNRHEMSDEETKQWLHQAKQRLQGLGQALLAGKHEVLRQVCETGEVVDRVQQAMEKIAAEELRLASSPRSL